MTDFQLKPETRVKLGIDEAPDSQKEETQDDVSTKETTKSEDKKQSEDKGDSKKSNAKDSEKNINDSDKSKSEATQKEQPSNGDDSEEEPKSFEDRVLSLIKGSDNFKDPEFQGKFLTDVPNWEKFTASNTQMRQKLAEDRKAFDNLVEKYSSDDLANAVEEVKNLDDLEDFLESADDWFEGEKNNPFRKLLSAIEDKPENFKEYTKEQREIAEKEAHLKFQEEVFNLKKLDPAYDSMDTLQEVAKIADEIGIDLKTAHDLRMSNVRADEIKVMNEQITSFKKQISDLKKELKQRNDQLAEKIKKEPLQRDVKPDAGGSGAEDGGFITPSNSYDETRQRLYKKLGVR